MAGTSPALTRKARHSAEPDAPTEPEAAPASASILDLVPPTSIPDSASEAEMAGTSPAMTVQPVHTAETPTETAPEPEAATGPKPRPPPSLPRRLLKNPPPNRLPRPPPPPSSRRCAWC